MLFPFSITVPLHLYPHVRFRPSDSYKPLFDTHTRRHACQALTPALPSNCLRSSFFQLSLIPLSTFCFNQLLVLCSTIVTSPYSNSYNLIPILLVFPHKITIMPCIVLYIHKWSVYSTHSSEHSIHLVPFKSIFYPNKNFKLVSLV